MAMKVDEIRLLPPRLVPMTDEQYCEAVELLADLILDRLGVVHSTRAPPLWAFLRASLRSSPLTAIRPQHRITAGDPAVPKKPTYKEEHE